MRRLIALVLVAVLAAAVAGCGDEGSVLGGDTTTAPATTEAPATTAAPTTLPPTTAPATTEAPATTTTAAPTTTSTTAAPTTTTTTAAPVYYEPPAGFFPDPLAGSGQAHGSGCVVPGGSATLPDGIWFGFAKTYSGSEIGFDLACFFTGETGWDKAAEDGEVGYDLDFYIRNNNPTIRQVELDPGARVFVLDTSGGGVELTEITAPAWPTGGGWVPCPGDYCAVWLYLNGGVVTHLVEQYLP